VCHCLTVFNWNPFAVIVFLACCPDRLTIYVITCLCQTDWPCNLRQPHNSTCRGTFRKFSLVLLHGSPDPWFFSILRSWICRSWDSMKCSCTRAQLKRVNCHKLSWTNDKWRFFFLVPQLLSNWSVNLGTVLGDSCHFYRRPHGVCAMQNLSQSLLISLQLEIFAFTHHNTQALPAVGCSAVWLYNLSKHKRTELILSRYKSVEQKRKLV